MSGSSTPLERVVAYINDASQITVEQRNAILSNARITVVRACPGSGKTRVFAARFAYEISRREGNRGGVVALSFTNVAQKEVLRRVDKLGVAAGYPHFIGTIDSFLLRFIVLRFGQELVDLSRFTHPLPDGDFSIQRTKLRYGPTPSESAALSSYRIEPDSNDKATCYVRPHRDDAWREVTDKNLKRIVIDEKKSAWKKGELTYSDVCAIAWKLLCVDFIRDLVVHRFSVILIDEFQDTGGIRETCIKKLFSSPHLVRSMLVGDPDQCIMEFAGARPELFDEFEQMPGAQSLSLTGCHRSYSGIAKVANHLQRAGQAYEGLRATDEESKTLLSTHSFKPRSSNLRGVVEAFQAFIGNAMLDESGAALLAWSGNTVTHLSGTTAISCPLEGPKWRVLWDGVSAYYAGDILELFESAEKVLSVCILDSPRPSDMQLQTLGFTRSDWKRLVWDLARKTCLFREDETLKQWSDRVRNDFERTAQEELKNTTVSWRRQLPIKVERGQRQKQAVLLRPMSDYISSAVSSHRHGVLIEKVHQIKGREFDAVCLFVPKPDSRGLGALDAWFGHIGSTGQNRTESANSGETRRVAYVAMTRAKRKLMVVIPADWYKELCSTPHGRSFVAAFGNPSPVPIESLLL